MKINLARIDAMIAELRDDKHSPCFLEGIVAHDTKSIDSLERALESAAFYGDSKKLATLMQLVFIRTLLKRPVGGQAWAVAAVNHLDNQVLRMVLMGKTVSRDVLLRQMEYERLQEQREIDEASRDVGA